MCSLPTSAAASLDLDLPAVPESLRTARHAVSAFAQAHRADPFAVALCVSEAVGEAVLFAYPLDAAGRVRLRGWREDRELRIVVEDDGTWPEPTHGHPARALSTPIIAAMSRHTLREAHDPGARLTLGFAVLG